MSEEEEDEGEDEERRSGGGRGCRPAMSEEGPGGMTTAAIHLTGQPPAASPSMWLAQSSPRVPSLCQSVPVHPARESEESHATTA